MESIQVVGDFTLVGQIVYEQPGALSEGVGIRIYRNVDASEKSRQFICVEDADSGTEAWYRVEGADLIPISLHGLERLPRNPR